MSNMISVASGFQYSVNIGYDLHSDDKLQNFIPTKSALNLLEELLLSTDVMANERARVLIGAYGKGKSHIVLTILAMLMKRDLALFEKLMPKVQERPRLNQLVQNYYDSDVKLLPIVITGSNTSIPQAFLLALQRTLSEQDFMDIMPETNYEAAVAVIRRWEIDFPETFALLTQKIKVPIEKFIAELEDFDVEAYEKFEKIYPTLTSGSLFNPFLGFDVVDLYESAVKGLRAKGYSGVYVIYDEFSKFLEANISEASVSDTKMLQDFAEKCRRSGALQMHVMLISHKEISNYIDVLPKQKVDGWRGVSERFKHLHLNNNFTQTYDIISTVIQKDAVMWEAFNRLNSGNFASVKQRYVSHAIFAETSRSNAKEIIRKCYPLHPISTFILPRLSEQIAQNERTLFTFLSANGYSTLSTFLAEHDDQSFSLLTPDIIFDYFEPLLKKEAYGSIPYQNYILAAKILDKLDIDSLDSKIIKTLATIYILGQFELLPPTKDELVGIYSTSYSIDEIEAALDRLIGQDYVLYLKRKNQFLQLKESSGVDLKLKIKDAIANQSKRINIRDTLNTLNFDKYMYPSGYNDEREMTRYFSFEFIDSQEITTNINWEVKSEGVDGDGIIYAIIPSDEAEIDDLRDHLIASSANFERFIFVLPNRFTEIEPLLKEYHAVVSLMQAALQDRVLYQEYETIYSDLRELIGGFIDTYTHPERFAAEYIHSGQLCTITRKAALTRLMSDICDEVYGLTPAINNEAVNRNEITSIAKNSRDKIVAGLLRNELEPNLGLAGSGQEVSIMRSTLLRTGILTNDDTLHLQLHPDDAMLDGMLQVIVDFVMGAQHVERLCFDELYNRLTSAEHHIGLRRGAIPIYLAVVLHEYKQDVVIADRFQQVPINADVLSQINASPSNFYISYRGWDEGKARFTQQLAAAYAEYIIDAERNINAYDYVALAMRRWYMNLPKSIRESKNTVAGERIARTHLSFVKLFKQNHGSYNLLFEQIPAVFNHQGDVDDQLLLRVLEIKAYYDNGFAQMKQLLIAEVKTIFTILSNENNVTALSLTSIIKDWCDSLDPMVFNQLFPNGANRCLNLFETVPNDEELFIARLAKAATDLRLEDWNDDSPAYFRNQLATWKTTAEEFAHEEVSMPEIAASAYQVTFTNAEGAATTKRFDRVECSNRAKLLHNAITAQLNGMGQSISEQEKRQVLIEVLEKLC